MFEYTAPVKGSIEYGYKLLLEQMVYEAAEKLQREVTLAEVEKGLKYKYKDGKKKENVTISLGPMNHNRHLVSRYTKAGQTIVMSYDFKEDEYEGTFLLTYKQEDGFAELKGFQKVMIERTMKKRFKKLSEAILKAEAQAEIDEEETTEA